MYSHFMILLVLCSLSSYAQIPLSLSDALQRGLGNNFQIRIVEKDIEISTRNNNLGNAGFYPTLNLTGGQSTTWNVVDDSINLFNFNSRNLNLTVGSELNWVLFKGFRVYIAKTRLNLLEEYSRGNETIIVENTIQAIMLAYYVALLEQEKLNVATEVLKLSRDRYSYEKIRKELGASGSFEELQFKTAYYSDSTTFLQQQIVVINTMTQLRQLLADHDDITYTLLDSLTFDDLSFQLEDLKSDLLAKNSTLRNQFINAAIFQKEVGLQKTNLYPTISLRTGLVQSFGTFKNQNEAELPFVRSTDLQSSRNYYINFSLAFNLFNGGNYLRAIKNSKVQAEIALLNIDDAKITLLNDLRFGFDQFNILKGLVNVSKINQESARLSLELAEGRFKNGSISSLDYRNLQLQYLSAAVRKLESVFNVKQTEIELLRLTGGILEEL